MAAAADPVAAGVIGLIAFAAKGMSNRSRGDQPDDGYTDYDTSYDTTYEGDNR